MGDGAQGIYGSPERTFRTIIAISRAAVCALMLLYATPSGATEPMRTGQLSKPRLLASAAGRCCARAKSPHPVTDEISSLPSSLVHRANGSSVSGRNRGRRSLAGKTSGTEPPTERNPLMEAGAIEQDPAFRYLWFDHKKGSIPETLCVTLPNGAFRGGLSRQADETPRIDYPDDRLSSALRYLRFDHLE